MLNVGPLELLVVLAVALVVVGPERLPELARSVGRALRQFREVQDEVRDLVSQGVDDDLRDAAADLRKATGDLRRATNVRGAVRRGARQALGDDEPARRTSEPPAAAPATTEPAPEEPGGAPAARLVDDAGAPADAPTEPTSDG